MNQIKAKVIRVCRTDSCGNVVGGSTGQIVSAGFTQVALKAQMQQGKDYYTQNAWGDACVNDLDCDRLKRYDLSITLCDTDPTIVEMMTGNRLITDDNGDPIGFAIQETPGSCDTGVTLELWTKISGGDCGEAPWAWGHWLFPFVRYGVLGDWTFDLNVITATINASTQHSAVYGYGPFNEWAPAIGSTEHAAFQGVNNAPPAVTDGYAQLTLPTPPYNPVAG